MNVKICMLKEMKLLKNNNELINNLLTISPEQYEGMVIKLAERL